MISINGVNYNGNSLSSYNGRIMIDDKTVEANDKVINIVINGNIDSIKVDNCQSVIVTGNSGEIKTMSGDVEIKGDVTGDVESMSGHIKCGDISGKVSTMSGNIKHL